MSVHQINEFYVHLEIPEKHRDAVSKLCLSEAWDHEMNEGDLTVDSFYSESHAIDCENQILAITQK